MVHLLTFIILFCSLSVQTRWSGDQNLALVREVLIREPYRFIKSKETTKRGEVWQQIADNLNFNHTLKFSLEEIRGFLEKLES